MASSFFSHSAFLLLTLAFSAKGFAEPVCITSPRANLRKGPGVQHAVSWSVGQNMPLYRLSQKGSWSQVKDLDGGKHWVMSEALSNKISCAVVKSKVAKLRKGPGTNYPTTELGSAERYTPFRKLERDGAWLLVQDEFKGKAWVNESNIWIPVSRTQMAF